MLDLRIYLGVFVGSMIQNAPKLSKKWKVVLGFLVVYTGYAYINRPPNPNEVITFYIGNKNNNHLLKITIKRCFLNGSTVWQDKIKTGDIVSRINLVFPRYAFSGRTREYHKTMLERCPEEMAKELGYGIEYVNIGERIDLSHHPIGQKVERRHDVIHVRGEVGIDHLFFKRDDISDYRTGMYYYRELDVEKWHNPIYNGYSVQSPLNHDLQVEYKIWTRFYGSKAEIEKSHAVFDPNQCIKNLGYCVPNNPADKVYDAVQRQQELIDCEECVEALRINDRVVVDLFNSFN